MLFGSAALFAILLSEGIWSSVRPAPCPWGAPAVGCARLAATMPPPARPTLDLRRVVPRSSTTDLLSRRWPIEIKSVKVVGASGLGFFAPLFGDVSVGVGVTSFKIGPQERALQTVAAIRVRF
jgi:hypothetical protein